MNENEVSPSNKRVTLNRALFSEIIEKIKISGRKKPFKAEENNKNGSNYLCPKNVIPTRSLLLFFYFQKCLTNTNINL